MVIMMSAAQWPVEHARTRHEDYRISRTMVPIRLILIAYFNVPLDAVVRAAWIRQIKTTPRLFLSLAGCFINSIRCARQSDRTTRLINLRVSTL
jgi:hypothetical protein